MFAGLFMLGVIILTIVSVFVHWWTGVGIVFCMIFLVAITDGWILRLIDFGFCKPCNKRVWKVRAQTRNGELDTETSFLVCPQCNCELT